MIKKSMLRLFIGITFIVLFKVSEAQIRFGILAGPHSASVFESSRLGFYEIKDYYKPRFSFHAGVFADLPFSYKSPVHFQPALIYSGKGRKMSTPPTSVLNSLENQNVQYVHKQQFLNYVDIPLNIVLKFPMGKNSNFFFGGGPQPSFLIGGKETTKVDDGSSQIGDTQKPKKGSGNWEYKGLDFGLNGLVGIEAGRIVVSINYSRSFSNFYTTPYGGSFRHNIIGGSIGFYLSKTKEAKARDRDSDGIPDKDDQCPTEAGYSNTNGCPDRDGDGIADKNDKCPDVKGLFNNNGCPPPDKDGDGVPDDSDKCPDTPGLQIYEGCPIPDKDGDGVNDFEDRCPTIPGPASNKGCPASDTDKDGIPDKNDKCPNIPGLEKYAGCPIPDSDGDGLNDEEDKCPTLKGPGDNGGCPVVAKDVVEKLNTAAQQVKFIAQKADLQSSSYKTLDQVATLLKQNPSLSLTIENYTNVLKTNDENQKLAVERANNIMAYIGIQGIDWTRMKATGYATEVIAVPANGKNPGNRTEFKLGN